MPKTWRRERDDWETWRRGDREKSQELAMCAKRGGTFRIWLMHQWIFRTFRLPARAVRDLPCVAREGEGKRQRHRHAGWDDERWELRLAELMEYHGKRGHTRVPAKWRENVSLGNWVATHRNLYRRGQIEPDRAE